MPVLRLNSVNPYRSLRWGLIVALALALLLPAGQAAAGRLLDAQAARQAGQIDRLIVRYRSASIAAKQPRMVARLSMMAVMPLRYGHPLSSGAHVYQTAHKMAVADARRVAQRIAREPNVLDVEPDYVMHLDQAPNDPLYPRQWGLGSLGGGIHVESAWAVTPGDPGVTIAVLDSGIRPGHIEFKGRLVPGYDFISDPGIAGDGDGRDPDPTDPGDYCGDPPQLSEWHGTHVAGIIGAAADNGIGIAGINSRSMILPVRTVGHCGGLESGTLDAMRWAVGMAVPGVPANPHPARILNLSMGVPDVLTCPAEFQKAIDDVRAHGALVVVSAGNDRKDAGTQMPANCHGVITVAAVDQLGNKADVHSADMDWGTNYGSVVTIAAPGVGILSTVNTGTMDPLLDNGYALYDGTSMAAPHVTGILSLMLSLNPRLTPDQATQLLLQARRPFAATANCASICAAGMADAGRAVQQVLAFAAARAPKVFAGAGQHAVSCSRVTLHGSAQAASPIVAWRWRQVAGPVVKGARLSGPSISFLAPATPGKIVLRLTAEDQQGQSASADVTVDVMAAPAMPPVSHSPAAWTPPVTTPVSQPPLGAPLPTQPPGAAAVPGVTAGESQTVAPGALVILDASAGVKAPAMLYSYHWMQIGGAPVRLANAGTLLPSFIAPQAPGDLTFRLTVIDRLGRSTSAVTAVHVMSPSAVQSFGAPRVQITAPATVKQDSQAVLRADAQASRTGQIVRYHWVQTGGAAVSQKATGSKLVLVAPALPLKRPLVLTFAVTVIDTYNRAATAVAALRVVP